MALGRGNTVVTPHSQIQTGQAAQTPELRRDADAERKAAIEAKIAAYEKAGLDTKHLKKLLGGSKARKATDGVIGADGVAVDVPQPMAPGTVPSGVPLSPSPDTVPEPEDGSAPDKRAQDQSPVYVEANADGTTGIVAGPADPGPEATKSNVLPVQPQPGEPIEVPRAVARAQAAHVEAAVAAAGATADGGHASAPRAGDETDEEAKARRAVANQTVPAPDVEPRPTDAERVEAAQAADDDSDDDEVEGSPATKAAVAKKAAAKAPAKKAAPAARRGR